LSWLEKHEDRLSVLNPAVAAMVDKSVPNLSSIMFLADADDMRILLTGDGRGDHLLSGLKEANLLDSKGSIHVDMLKVPHHGSNRNVTADFFKRVTADKYIISANGKYGNPDFNTLEWIVLAAKEQNRNIKICTTNATTDTKKLLVNYDQVQCGYEMISLKKGDHSMILEKNS
jgi:beta-lactamase superfamily II metal-dependent hydrolase